ncbi:hypothetical protein PLICRDRAFT_103577 [Plicaturopsis crispa FD-325 SS-3]|nr:hypothetical protein PLICRDRAFT_103577 [Plicaturopsis crispa FD-325 SS-3]
MKHLYPASSDIPTLRDDELALKIARHSPCSACTSCPALHPPPGANVVSTASTEPGSSLGDLAAYGSDDDDGAQTTYLDTCACGHGVREHGADEPALGREEFARRGRVAVRLDELLQDVGKLLDFEYTDDDIVSLRLQMRLPVALTSTTSPTTDTLPSRGTPSAFRSTAWY